MDLNKHFELFAEKLDKEISYLDMLAKQYGIFCCSNKSVSIKFYEDKIELHFTKEREPMFTEKLKHDISSIVRKAGCTGWTEYLNPEDTVDNYIWHIIIHNAHTNQNYAKDFDYRLLDQMKEDADVYKAVMHRLEEEVLARIGLNSQN